VCWPGHPLRWRPARTGARTHEGPFRLSQNREDCLESWLGTLLILIGWLALQVWVLPRLGVPT
jgi:hypothetical protein